jgi:hypothetical protein
MRQLLDRGWAAFLIGAIFIVTGIVYYFGGELWGNGQGYDPAGTTMLIIVGVAMTFAFMLVLRGSREL